MQNNNTNWLAVSVTSKEGSQDTTEGSSCVNLPGSKKGTLRCCYLQMSRVTRYQAPGSTILYLQAFQKAI